MFLSGFIKRCCGKKVGLLAALTLSFSLPLSEPSVSMLSPYSSIQNPVPGVVAGDHFDQLYQLMVQIEPQFEGHVKRYSLVQAPPVLNLVNFLLVDLRAPKEGVGSKKKPQKSKQTLEKEALLKALYTIDPSAISNRLQLAIQITQTYREKYGSWHNDPELQYRKYAHNCQTRIERFVAWLLQHPPFEPTIDPWYQLYDSLAMLYPQSIKKSYSSIEVGMFKEVFLFYLVTDIPDSILTALLNLGFGNVRKDSEILELYEELGLNEINPLADAVIEKLTSGAEDGFAQFHFGVVHSAWANLWYMRRFPSPEEALLALQGWAFDPEPDPYTNIPVDNKGAQLNRIKHLFFIEDSAPIEIAL